MTENDNGLKPGSARRARRTAYGSTYKPHLNRPPRNAFVKSTREDQNSIALADARLGVPYMPALDGLRALAVLAVVLYHFNLSFAKGGLIGVTVFFVISGYLIARLLRSEFATSHTISFRKFYVRRIRRIIPLAVTVIVVVAALCTVFSQPLLSKMRPDVIPSLLFYNNWAQIARGDSYFASIGLPSPISHFWSLSIEEQFYLVAPFLLLLAFKMRLKRRFIARILLTLAGISAITMALLYSPDIDPSRVYYGTDTRAFGLLIGMALAFISPEKIRARFSDAQLRLGSLVALCVLLVYVLFVPGDAPYLYWGGFFVASLVSGVAILGLTVPQAGLLTGVLSSAPLVWVGLRSYGIYLWHYPIALLLSDPNGTVQYSIGAIVIACVLTVVAAELSYRLIEKPVKKAAFWKHLMGGRVEAHSQKNSLSQNAHQTHMTLGLFRKTQPVRFATFVVLAGCFLVGFSGLLFAPETSFLSDEGEKLINGEIDPSTLVASVPPRSADDTENTYLAHDPRTDEQKEFDEKLVNTPVADGAYPVTWLGDSISLRIVPYFQREFPTSYIDAKKNRRVKDGLDIIKQLKSENKLGNIVVFALGNNSLYDDAMVDTIVETVGEDRAIWLPTLRYRGLDTEATNEAVRRAAARYPNVRVIDWSAISADNPWVFDGDGAHLTGIGAAFYFDHFLDGINCELPAAQEESEIE